MADEERKVNIMSVELAVKRELAYREKLARLYPEDDWRNEILPLEVSSSTMEMASSFPSSAHLSGSHSTSILNNWSPFPYSCLNLLSTPRIQSQDAIRCPRRDMELAKVSIHSIAKENSTANSFQCHPSQWTEPIYISNRTNFFCKVCQVSCSGPVSFKQHIRGQRHKAILQKQQPTRNAGGANKCNYPRCNLSNIWSSSEDGFSQKRKAKLSEGEHGKRGKGSEQLWCQLCQVACSHEDTYWLHLKGKTHVTNLQARGKK